MDVKGERKKKGEKEGKEKEKEKERQRPLSPPGNANGLMNACTKSEEGGGRQGEEERGGRAGVQGGKRVLVREKRERRMNVSEGEEGRRGWEEAGRGKVLVREKREGREEGGDVVRETEVREEAGRGRVFSEGEEGEEKRC